MKNDVYKKIEKQVSDYLRKICTPYVGKKKLSLECIEEEVMHTLMKMKNKHLVDNAEICSCTGMWDTWSWWKKLAWFMKNKLKLGRMEIKRYERQYRDFYNHLIQEKYDDDMIISMTRSWEDTHKKYWYEGSPKSVVLISYSLSYIKPANYIQVEGVLENEKETTI